MVCLKPDVLRWVQKRLLKTFLDFIVLAELTNRPMSSYDVISYVHRKFGILLSSGGVYSQIYSMEREGLIKGRFDRRKRVYDLTSKGRETIKNIEKANSDIKRFMEKILMKATEV